MKQNETNKKLRLTFGIFRGSNTEMFAEDGGEVGQIRESYRISHLRHIDFLLFQEPCSLFQSDVTDKLTGGDSRQFLHLTMQLYTADTHLLGQTLHIEIAVGDILIDGFHDTFHQHLVVAAHLRLVNLFRLSLLCTGILTFQA